MHANCDGPLERAAFAANVAPAPVLDYVGALGLCAMFTGLRVGVLTALAPTLSTPTCTAAKNSSGSARLMVGISLQVFRRQPPVILTTTPPAGGQC